MEKIKNLNTNISFNTILKTIIFLLFLYLLYELKELVLVFLTAIVLAAAIEPFISKMEKFKIPRIFSVSFVYIILILTIFGAAILLIPSIIDQINYLLKLIPTYIDNINGAMTHTVSNESVSISLIQQIEDKVLIFISDFSSNFTGSGITNNAQLIGNLIFGFFGGVLNFILILVFSFYLALQDHGIENFLKIVTPVKYTKYALNLWKRTQKKISLWMQGQFILMIIVGTLTYIGLKIFFDFEQSLLLGIIAGFTEIIPIVGPVLAAIPAIIIAFTLDGISLVALVAIFYFVVQMIENQLIYPLVVNKVVGVPSIVVIISLITGVQLFGFLGAILAIPVAAAFMEYFKDVEKRQLEALKKGHEKEVDLSRSTEHKEDK